MRAQGYETYNPTISPLADLDTRYLLSVGGEKATLAAYTANATASQDLDLSIANAFQVIMGTPAGGSITLNLKGATSGALCTMTVEFFEAANAGATTAVTWAPFNPSDGPGNLIWPAGEPSFTTGSSEATWITFQTVDGGGTWFGFSGIHLGIAYPQLGLLTPGNVVIGAGGLR
jgi:hypothetical protein